MTYIVLTATSSLVRLRSPHGAVVALCLNRRAGFWSFKLETEAPNRLTQPEAQAFRAELDNLGDGTWRPKVGDEYFMDGEDRPTIHEQLAS